MRRLAQAASVAVVFAGMAVSTAASASQNLLADLFSNLLVAPRIQTSPARQAALQPDVQEAGPTANIRIPRETVFFDEDFTPGTVVIKTSERRLYFVLPDNKAIRYGIGVGRDGFRWSGTEAVSKKQEWPDWRPPAEMLERRPDLPRYMAGGPENPLGARALYLGKSLYRIHGSNEPDTIGHAVSSGCFRMLNDDVVDLYERVSVGTSVVVLR
jgi:lipoprotein-anchoring transpeptidase ErfK/SrfK